MSRETQILEELCLMPRIAADIEMTVFSNFLGKNSKLGNFALGFQVQALDRTWKVEHIESKKTQNYSFPSNKIALSK